MHRDLTVFAAPSNNALHQTRRGGAAVFPRRRPVVEARLAGERECCAGLVVSEVPGR